MAAQKFTGTISGIVSDPQGALIAKAEINVINPATGETRLAHTNDHGEYVVPQLDPGTYDVRIKHPNFKEYVAKGVVLNVSSTTTVNATLAVGSVTEVMTVEASAVQVETSNGTVSNVVEGKQVRELPLNGRSFAELTQLMPGVSPQSNFNSKNKGLEAGVDFSVNGNNTTGNLFMVDGVNNNDIGSNRTILVYPSIDAIQEFKILRNSYGPEYGQAMGAIINIVTKGGTNQWHGGAYYFGRNNALNATDYFNKLNNAAKDVVRVNDYGYNVGGPILKDKLFFFWSEEWNKEKRGRLRQANVPTAAEKAGNFTTLRPGCENTPKIGGSAVTAIPAGQMSAAGALLLQLFPDPNISSPVNCINWALSLAAPVNWRQENIRADYNLTSTWKIFGRFTQDKWNQGFPSTLGFWGDDRYPSVESQWNQPGYQATIKLTKIFGSAAVNDFQLSYAANRITATRGGTNPGLNDQIVAALPTFYSVSQKQAGNQMGYPIFWGGLGNGANSDNLWTLAPWHNNEELYIMKDDYSKVVGSHTFKVGFLASNNKKNELVGPSDSEAANFWGAATNDTGNGAFNALWNQVQWGFGETQNNPYSRTRWHDFEFYYGDNWKARRNLTVEYGFRWSLLRNPYSAVDKIASFQPSLYNPADGNSPCNGVLVVKTSFCTDLGFAGGVAADNRSLRQQSNHAIAPRLGVAWDPKGDGKMSVRVGVGQFFQRERVNNSLYMASNVPFALSAGGNRAFDTAPATLSASGTPSIGVTPSGNIPNTWQWNLTVERELARATKLELAYVANRGIHLLRYVDANAIAPANRLAFALDNSNSHRPFGAGSWGAVNYAEWTANSNYNALQALFRTRLKGLDAQFAYTWSKSLANTDITNSGGAGQASDLLDPTNPNLDYGPTGINRPHILVGNLVYDLPSFKGHNALTRTALGGWEMSGILTFSSGTSITVYSGNVNPAGAPGGLTGTSSGQASNRPNQVPGQGCRAPTGTTAKYQWLNPNRWTLNGYQVGTFGSSRVGSCLGPGIANVDYGLYKNFKLTERFGLQFRMDFFNLFNKTQFSSVGGPGGLNNTLATGGGTMGAGNIVTWNPATDRQQTFGQVSGDHGPRELQYSLKFSF
jgi:hypothetical protein